MLYSYIQYDKLYKVKLYTVWYKIWEPIIQYDMRAWIMIINKATNWVLGWQGHEKVNRE